MADEYRRFPPLTVVDMRGIQAYYAPVLRRRAPGREDPEEREIREAIAGLDAIIGPDEAVSKW